MPSGERVLACRWTVQRVQAPELIQSHPKIVIVKIYCPDSMKSLWHLKTDLCISSSSDFKLRLPKDIYISIFQFMYAYIEEESDKQS